MNISGTQNLEAPPDIVWSKVIDPAVLERVIPGLDMLTSIGPDEYEADSNIKMGPVKGNFKGHLKIVDQVPPKSCKVVLAQNSKIGNVTAEISMELQPTEDNKTIITYNGESKLSGTLARMGQRIVGGVVKTLSKQFFEGLENELNPN